MKLFLYEFASARLAAVTPASIRREGAAILDAVRADASRIPGVVVIEMPPCETAEEPATFRASAGDADACLVLAPEFDGCLTARVNWVQAAGTRHLGCPPALIELAADKWQCYQIWCRTGVPTPSTWLPGASVAHEPPWIRKWRIGAGSQEMALIGPQDLLPVGRAWLLQKRCFGHPVSLAFLCGPQGFRLPLLAGMQVLDDDGTFAYRGGNLPLRPDLQRRAEVLAEKALEALASDGWLGYVSVDLLLGDADDGGADLVVEVNPRLTTSYLGLRAMTAANLLEWWLRIAAGERPASPAWHPGGVEFTAEGEVRRLA